VILVNYGLMQPEHRKSIDIHARPGLLSVQIAGANKEPAKAIPKDVNSPAGLPQFANILKVLEGFVTNYLGVASILLLCLVPPGGGKR
jgi:hypothetical protein